MTRIISPKDLKNLLATRQDIALLDVRRKVDFDADTQKLPNAIWKNPEEVTQWYATLPQDKEVIVYCARGGSVSNATIDHLHGRNIRARFVEGGIEAWKNNGGETVGK